VAANEEEVKISRALAPLADLRTDSEASRAFRRIVEKILSSGTAEFNDRRSQ
jgi:hypothetical protein